jgi:hypothetical protein
LIDTCIRTEKGADDATGASSLRRRWDRDSRHRQFHGLVIDSHSPGFDFFRLSFESLRDAVVDAGLLSRADADAAAVRFAEDTRVLTPTMIAGIGRR